MVNHAECFSFSIAICQGIIPHSFHKTINMLVSRHDSAPNFLVQWACSDGASSEELQPLFVKRERAFPLTSVSLNARSDCKNKHQWIMTVNISLVKVVVEWQTRFVNVEICEFGSHICMFTAFRCYSFQCIPRSDLTRRWSFFFLFSARIISSLNNTVNLFMLRRTGGSSRRNNVVYYRYVCSQHFK